MSGALCLSFYPGQRQEKQKQITMIGSNKFYTRIDIYIKRCSRVCKGNTHVPVNKPVV